MVQDVLSLEESLALIPQPEVGQVFLGRELLMGCNSPEEQGLLLYLNWVAQATRVLLVF